MMYFQRSEFVCPCCGKLKLARELWTALELLRRMTGKPIHVNSGFRCKAHNSEVGGKRHSKHLLGQAADIRCPGLLPQELAALAEEIPSFATGGIGLYSTFIHVDVRPKAARWAA